MYLNNCSAFTVKIIGIKREKNLLWNEGNFVKLIQCEIKTQINAVGKKL